METPVFTRAVGELLPDEEYRRLQVILLLRPEIGDVISGSGGLRKLRWRSASRGKRGGLRLIYYWDAPSTMYMLLVYKKSRRDDLSPLQLKTLKSLVRKLR